MFGLGKNEPNNDRLSVQAHSVVSAEAFALAQKLWTENGRTVRLDQASGKEYLHFAYLNPKCVIWFQRDRGRADSFELIVRWESTKTYEVYVVMNGQPVGNEARAKALLQSMLTTPSVVPSTES